MSLFTGSIAIQMDVLDASSWAPCRFKADCRGDDRRPVTATATVTATDCTITHPSAHAAYLTLAAGSKGPQALAALGRPPLPPA